MARESKATIDEKMRLKNVAQNMEAYLNRLEEIGTSFSMAETKEEKLTEIFLLVGKCQITFSDIAKSTHIFDVGGSEK